LLAVGCRVPVQQWYVNGCPEAVLKILLKAVQVFCETDDCKLLQVAESGYQPGFRVLDAGI
jgi:hypothetical protein